MKQPTIFVNDAGGRFFGFEGYCDAYVFWPRIRVEDGVLIGLLRRWEESDSRFHNNFSMVAGCDSCRLTRKESLCQPFQLTRC